MIGETIVCLLSGQQTTTVSSKYCTAAVLRALLVMVHLYCDDVCVFNDNFQATQS
jgi:hypothetical protein